MVFSKLKIDHNGIQYQEEARLMLKEF